MYWSHLSHICILHHIGYIYIHIYIYIHTFVCIYSNLCIYLYTVYVFVLYIYNAYPSPKQCLGQSAQDSPQWWAAWSPEVIILWKFMGYMYIGYIHRYIYIYIHIYIYILYVYTYIYVYMYVCMFIGYVHLYIYIRDLGNKQLMLMGNREPNWMDTGW